MPKLSRKALEALKAATQDFPEDSEQYEDMLFNMAMFALRIISPHYSKQNILKTIDVIYDSPFAMKE